MGGVFGHAVMPPDRIPDLDFDYVVIAVCARHNLHIIRSIRRQCLEMKIPDDKIILMGDERQESLPPKYPRISFLYNYAEYANNKNLLGSVAECGVWMGDYAAHINNAFPNRAFHLFDTFDAVPECDLEHEPQDVIDEKKSENTKYRNSRPSEVTLLKCRFRDKLAFHEGYVPETLSAVEGEQFVYVHLDMDIYAPTKSGLEFFAPRMVNGGVIAVHDYYGYYSGVKKAVGEFLDSNKNVKLSPIGDNSSVVLLF
jgi:hypothetical protein